ncbi:serine hydrolase domain-containing protein [Lewinella sp. IMCC34183]|uniref:serine hydrolase domain-containing protein n=1 Tax=Lewinella sp. IMCC34183 TaxID=2248762 RepID=UPI00130077A1|nr:serine hydrolase [Lewinella sp. IMCC34183]
MLLFSAASTDAEVGWGEWVVDWFSSWFVEAPAETLPVAAPAPVAAADLALFSVVPGSDTLTRTTGWPYVSVDAAADVDRRERLLAQTVLATNPAGRLPLVTASAVRILYQEGQRPDYFIDMARRFADVQAVAFGDRLAPALAAAPDLPTLVVVTDPPTSVAPAHWYRALYSLGNFTLIHYGTPDLVTDLPTGWEWVNCLLRAKESESFVAQAVFGAQELNGRFADGTGLELPAVRTGFREPEATGVDRERLGALDQVINRAIRFGATPGAQLAVLKDGEVIYERAYGNHRYRRSEPVRVSDLYDLASVTKAAATTLAVMKLYDEGRLRLDARVSDYLPEYRDRTPGRYRIDQLLTHHTGLQSNLPLYPYLHEPFLSNVPTAENTLALSPRRYLASDVPARLRADLARLDHTRRPVYRYSDVNYVLLQFIVEAIAGEGLDTYVARNFYEPLGLRHLSFRPLERFGERQLVPTIVDKWMRRGELRGYVHDEGAALLGGVAGHAGLFGNASDLGRLFQLLLDGGAYDGRQLLSRATVERFTEQGPYNRRALGFDRLAAGYASVVRAGASDRTFGHTGFTGTCVWADPDNDLVFVLLTNRTYPDPDNSKFMKYGTRSRMQRDLYRALGSFRSATAA